MMRRYEVWEKGKLISVSETNELTEIEDIQNEVNQLYVLTNNQKPVKLTIFQQIRRMVGL